MNTGIRHSLTSAAVLLSLALHVPASAAAQTPARVPAQTPTEAAPPPSPGTPPSAAPASEPEAPAVAQPGSEVRIVRLSEIRGEAQLDRNTGRGFEDAFANLPIVEGARLITTQGIAEVEFEDNSTLRLTPNSLVEFPTLRLDPSGATISTIHVLRGAVYVSLTNHKSNNQFTLRFGADDKVLLRPASHIALSLAAPGPRISVFDGVADVQYGSVTTSVGKKHSLVFDPASGTAPTLLAKIEKTEFDDWDKQAVDYHKRYANASNFGSSSAFSGVSDLNYYGSFAALPGCGNVWRPYFASAAWDPFANGVWAWYPNAGFSWVSPYPWGWAPFHSGSWQQCSAGGWGWRPGGRWVGLGNSVKCPEHHHGGPTHLRPPLPPSPGHPTMVAVNSRPLPVSRLTGSDSFVFHKDSAGLGIPRQGFGKLGGVSNNVARHGDVSASVYSAPGLVPFRTGRDSAVANERRVEAQAVHGAALASGTQAANSANSRSAGHNTASANGSNHTAGGSSGYAHSSGGSSSAHGNSSASSGGGGGYSGGSHASAPSPTSSAPASSSSAPSHK